MGVFTFCLISLFRLKTELELILQSELERRERLANEGLLELHDAKLEKPCSVCSYDCYVSGVFFFIIVLYISVCLFAYLNLLVSYFHFVFTNCVFIHSRVHSVGVYCTHHQTYACLLHSKELCTCPNAQKRVLVRVPIEELKRLVSSLGFFINIFISNPMMEHQLEHKKSTVALELATTNNKT
jgi:hypothetical protein